MPSATSNMKSVTKSHKKLEKKKPSKKMSTLPAPEDANTASVLPTVGHILQKGEIRSTDVWVDENVRFADMYLSREVLAGLEASGFHRPSPVQLKVSLYIGCC